MIPKEIRDRLGIQPGDEVDFLAGESEVTIRPAGDDPAERARRIDSLMGSWGDSPGGGTKDLEAERCRERVREEAKFLRLTGGSS